MVVYSVLINSYNENSSIIDLYGIYSNLPLAASAAINSIKNIHAPNVNYFTFKYLESSWGYIIIVIAHNNNETWPWQEIEIGRVTVNE